MRHLRYLPLAFIAGTQGFAVLAPYLVVVLGAAWVLDEFRRVRRERFERVEPAPLVI